MAAANEGTTYFYDPKTGKYFTRVGNDIVFVNGDPTGGAGGSGMISNMLNKKKEKPSVVDKESLYDEELYGHGLQEEREKESERISMDKNRALRLEYAAMERMMNERQRQAGMSGINQMRYDANHMPMQGFGYAHGGQVPRYESGGDQGYQGDFIPIGAGPRVIMIQSPEQKKKEEEKSLWQKIKDAATGLGAGIVTPVAAAWAMQKWGPNRDRDNTGKSATSDQSSDSIPNLSPAQIRENQLERFHNEIFPQVRNFNSRAERTRFLQHHSPQYRDFIGGDKDIYDAYRDYINRTPEGVTLEQPPENEAQWIYNNNIAPRFERVRNIDPNATWEQYSALTGGKENRIMTPERPLSFLMDRFNNWERRTYPDDVQGLRFNPAHYPQTHAEEMYGGILPEHNGAGFDAIRYLDDTGFPPYVPTPPAAAYGGAVPRYADGGRVSDITSRIQPSEGVMKLGRDLIAKYKNPNIQSFAKGGTLSNIDNYMAEKTGKWRYPIYGGGGLLALYGGYKALPGGIKLGKFLKHKFDEWRAKQQKEEAKPADPTPAATAPQTPDPHKSPLVQSTSSQPELDSEFSMQDLPESEPSTFFQEENMYSPHSMPNEQADYSAHSEPPSEHPEPPQPPAWAPYEKQFKNIYGIANAASNKEEMLNDMLGVNEDIMPGYTDLYNQYAQARADHPSAFESAGIPMEAHGGVVPRYSNPFIPSYAAGGKKSNSLAYSDNQNDTVPLSIAAGGVTTGVGAGFLYDYIMSKRREKEEQERLANIPFDEDAFHKQYPDADFLYDHIINHQSARNQYGELTRTLPKGKDRRFGLDRLRAWEQKKYPGQPSRIAFDIGEDGQPIFHNEIRQNDPVDNPRVFATPQDIKDKGEAEVKLWRTNRSDDVTRNKIRVNQASAKMTGNNDYINVNSEPGIEPLEVAPSWRADQIPAPMRSREDIDRIQAANKPWNADPVVANNVYKQMRRYQLRNPANHDDAISAVQAAGHPGLVSGYNDWMANKPADYIPSDAYGGVVPRYAQGGSAKKFARDAWGRVQGAGRTIGGKIAKFDDEMDRRVGPLRFPIYGAGAVGLEELIRRTAKHFWNKRKGNQEAAADEGGDAPSSGGLGGFWPGAGGSDSTSSSSSSGGDQGDFESSGSVTSEGHPKHYVRPPEPTFSSSEYESSLGKFVPVQRKINPATNKIETVPGTGVFVQGPVMKKKIASTRDPVKQAHQYREDWIREQREAENDFNYDQEQRHKNKVPKIKPPKSKLPNQIPLTIPDGPLPPDPNIDVDSLWENADVESSSSSPVVSPRTRIRKANQERISDIGKSYRNIDDLELSEGLPQSTRPNRIRFAHPPRDVNEWPEHISPPGSARYRLPLKDKEEFFKSNIPTVRHTTAGPRANPHKVGDEGLIRPATTSRVLQPDGGYTERPIDALYGVYVPGDRHYPGGIKKDAYGPNMPRRDLADRKPLLYSGTMDMWNNPARRNDFYLLSNSDSDEQYRGATEADWQDYQNSIRQDDLDRNQAAIDNEIMTEYGNPHLIIDPGERYQHPHQDRVTKHGEFSRNPKGSGFTRQPYWDVHDEHWYNKTKDNFVPATADMELIGRGGTDLRSGKPISAEIINKRTSPFKIYPPAPKPVIDNFISNTDIALKDLRDNAKSRIVSMVNRSPLLPYPIVEKTRSRYDKHGVAGKAKMVEDTRQQAIDLLHGHSSFGPSTSLRPSSDGIFTMRYGRNHVMPPISREKYEGIYKDTSTQTDQYFGNPIDLPQNAQHTFPKMWRAAQGQYDPNVGEARLRRNLKLAANDEPFVETPQFAQEPIDTPRAMELIRLKGHRGTDNPPAPGSSLHEYHRHGEGINHRHRVMGSDMDVYHRGIDFPAHDDSSDGVLTPYHLQPIRQIAVNDNDVQNMLIQRGLRSAEEEGMSPASLPDAPSEAYGGSVRRFAQGGSFDGPLKGNDIYKKGQWKIPRKAEPIAGGALLTAASIPLIRGIHRMTQGKPFLRSHKFEDEYLDYRKNLNDPFFQALDPDSQENYRQSALMQKGDRNFMTRFADYNDWTEKNKDWLDKNFPDTPINWIPSRRPADPSLTQSIDHSRLHHGDLPETSSDSIHLSSSGDAPHVHRNVLDQRPSMNFANQPIPPQSTMLTLGAPQVSKPAPLAYGGRVPRYAFGGFTYDTSKDARREGDRSSEPIFGKGSYTMGGTLRTDTYQPTNPLDYAHHQYQSAQKGAYGFPMSLATNVAPLGLSLYRPMVGASINAATNLMSGNLTGALMNTWPLFRGRKAAQAAGTSFFGTPGLLSNPSRLLNFDYRTPGGKANMINMGMMALPPALGILSRANQRPYNYNESLTNQMGSYY